MLRISPQDIEKRLAKDNPWWAPRGTYISPYANAPRCVYFDPFFKISTDTDIKRAAILLGPRRVGKTVMLQQAVDQLIENGVPARRIMYVSIDAPAYAGIPLEDFLDILIQRNRKVRSGHYYVMFDEIQYLKDWELHLKDLVDRYPLIKFIASGSAAAALQLKSRESGAGRFSDFLLPPLTFYEFVKFLKHDNLLEPIPNTSTFLCRDIHALNVIFMEYLNYGGFPELALNPKIRDQIDQFIKNDIIDKVLLKDLPSLYGIPNTQELNSLFSFLAYNTGQEASLEAISQNSSLSKTTLTNYISYLKTAFLISTLQKMPTSSKGVLRQRNFKVYLVNPSMRSALFGEIDTDDTTLIGHLTEAAILSQWHHLPLDGFHYYWRDKRGQEIDLVSTRLGKFHPASALEIKWSDKVSPTSYSEIKNLISFAKKHKLTEITVTSKTARHHFIVDGIDIFVTPASQYCLNIGASTTKYAINTAWRLSAQAIAFSDTSEDD